MADEDDSGAVAAAQVAEAPPEVDPDLAPIENPVPEEDLGEEDVAVMDIGAGKDGEDTSPNDDSGGSASAEATPPASDAASDAANTKDSLPEAEGEITLEAVGDSETKAETAETSTTADAAGTESTEDSAAGIPAVNTAENNSSNAETEVVVPPTEQDVTTEDVGNIETTDGSDSVVVPTGSDPVADEDIAAPDDDGSSATVTTAPGVEGTSDGGNDETVPAVTEGDAPVIAQEQDTTAARTGPWIIEVHAVNAAGASSAITVEIERNSERKRWLGGYRHKKTGLAYHNVSTQTYVKTRKPDGKVRFTREVQTKQLSSGVTNEQQTISETSTQMTGTGCYIATGADKVITARPYFTAAQRDAQRLAAVMVLQSYFRRMRAIEYVKDLRKRKEVYDAWMTTEEARKQKEEEAEFQSRIDRRLNPRTKDDFQLLYSGLEVWRKEQLAELQGLEGDTRVEALNGLLHQQCQYLGAIGQLKNIADENNRLTRIKKFFDTTAAPKKWTEPEYGYVMEMETPDTIRARELREVYNGLGFANLEMDERLDILLHCKLTVQNYNSKVSRELVGLIIREGDLLARGTRESNLDGLRKRIQNLFLRLCEDKEFNPEAGKYLAVHKPKDKYGSGLLKCMGTENYLEHDEFVFRDPHHVPFQSNTAKKMQNIGQVRKDTTQYKRILDSIRNSEIDKGYSSQLVFLMSVEDIVYIIDTIWGSKSVLSQEDEIFRLTLARWNVDEEFSPWNCVLLTLDEAQVHATASKDMALGDMYGKALTRMVQQKHLRARGHFLSLVDTQQKRQGAGDATAGVP